MLVKTKDLKNTEVIIFRMPNFEEEQVFNEIKDEDESSHEQMENVEKNFIFSAQDLENHISSKEQEAFDKGFISGEKAGFEAGVSKANVFLSGIEEIYKNLASLKDNIVKEIEPKIITLAIEIAKKIIMTELSIKPEIMLNIVMEAIRKIEIIDKLTIKLNPALYDFFIKNKIKLFSNDMELNLDVDPSVPVYGPVIIGVKEVIVTDIEEQLKIIERCVNEALTTE